LTPDLSGIMDGPKNDGDNLKTATYSAAAVYFAIVGILAAVVNVSIISVYLKNKKVAI
jgi:hypothetical protein